MDQRSEPELSLAVSVSGLGCCALLPALHRASDIPVVGHLLEPTLAVEGLVKNPKSIKFMGKQDRLALLAAHRAVSQARLSPDVLAQRTGLYLVSGYIPFEREEVDALTENSQRDGELCMQRFATEGIEAVNPLLTFRCLPNMPAFHVSLNLGMRGSYFVSYPGIEQLYTVLSQAVEDLARKNIDAALVGAVADQRNFLVQHHYRRAHMAAAELSVDCAAFLCLRRSADVGEEKIGFNLTQLVSRYNPYVSQPDGAGGEVMRTGQDRWRPGVYQGAASLLANLSWWWQLENTAEFTHQVERNGFNCFSRWCRL